ncbi:MAG: SufE family protein [Crocinitomicaceae bacterium]|nr:SufE family protein [Crocinitomicaceae bacterium]
MKIEEIENEIIDEFGVYDDWMDKYEYIIELGKDLDLIQEANKTDDKLIKGCQSRVWLDSEMKDGVLKFYADSDAIITKGIISLLLRVFSGQKPEDIVTADLDFIDKIGLQEHLSPTRANGLLSMVKQIKLLALQNVEK